MIVARVWRTFVPRDLLAMRKWFTLVSMGDDVTRTRSICIKQYNISLLDIATDVQNEMLF